MSRWRYLVSTKVEPQLCPRCHELALVAMVEGLRTRVDPYPTEPAIEAIAIIAGRPTFTLYNRELYRRVGGTTALPGPVLVAHICHRPLRADPSPRDLDEMRNRQPETPPF